MNLWSEPIRQRSFPACSPPDLCYRLSWNAEGLTPSDSARSKTQKTGAVWKGPAFILLWKISFCIFKHFTNWNLDIKNSLSLANTLKSSTTPKFHKLFTFSWNFKTDHSRSGKGAWERRRELKMLADSPRLTQNVLLGPMPSQLISSPFTWSTLSGNGKGGSSTVS